MQEIHQQPLKPRPPKRAYLVLWMVPIVILLAVAALMVWRPWQSAAIGKTHEERVASLVDELVAEGYVVDGDVPRLQTKGSARVGSSLVKSHDRVRSWKMKFGTDGGPSCSIDVARAWDKSARELLEREWRRLKPRLTSDEFESGGQIIGRVSDTILQKGSGTETKEAGRYEIYVTGMSLVEQKPPRSTMMFSLERIK